MAPMEEKLKQAQAEVQQLRISVKNYEGMIENYKSQVGILPKPAALAMTFPPFTVVAYNTLTLCLLLEDVAV